MKMWKITKNIDDMKHYITPVGVQSFNISMITDDERVADYFRNNGIHSGNTPMFTVEEITETDTEGS